MKGFGTRQTFRILGVAAFLTALFYFFFNQFYIIPKHKDKLPGAVSDREEPVDQEETSRGFTNCAFQSERNSD